MSTPPNSSTSRLLRPGHFYGQVLRNHIGHGIILTELEHQQPRRLPAHSHELAFFHLLLYGHYRETFGRRTATLKPFTTIFHPSGVTHHDEIGPSGMRVFSVELQDEWLDRLREIGVAPQSSIALPGSELSLLAMRLYREYLNLDRCSVLVIEGLVLEMLALVARPERVHERRPPEWLSKVEDLLKSSFQENLTITEVAAQVSVNPAHLSRVFRQFHNQAIGDYLHDLRVQFACRQLADPNVTLSAIASASGFADQSHFTRVFKHCTGMTPGAFRALVLSNGRRLEGDSGPLTSPESS
ncbi:MAG TPA: AraC family transcriptional regulator [Pyrinomonadaceae bacterium]|nr:AraC family transcriptional regulator [Pyrinomonadaceae bacterium]